MIADLHMGLVAEVVFKTSCASGLTILALRAAAGRTAAERSFVAHLGLAATVAIPFAAMALPYWSPNGALAWLDEIRTPVWLYVAPAALLAAATLVAIARLFGLRKRAAVLVEPNWLGALAHAQRRMGFKSGAALLVSRDIVSPVSWGLFRPTIVLDERALGAKNEAEAIISHELAHVARADWAKLLLARTATALFWFNPLVWLLARQCHELREEAADDSVLRHEIDGSDYAAILVGHARHECRGILLAAHGVAPGRGSLRRRITRVLDTSRRRAPAGLGFAVAGFAVGLAIGTPLAALTVRAPKMRPATAAPRTIPVAVQPTRVAVDLEDGGKASVTVMTRGPSIAREAHAVVTGMAGQLIADVVTPLPAKPAAPVSSPRFTPGELIAMSTQGVTAGWLREMAALGYTGLSGGEIAALATQGVSPSYVRALAELGYPRLAAGQLIALAVQGVTPAYVREIVQAGGPRPTPEQLVAYRIRGVEAELIRAAAGARASADRAREEIDAVRGVRYGPPPLPLAPPRRSRMRSRADED